MKTLARASERLLEKNLIPDPLVRFGIRGLLKEKLKKAQEDGLEYGQERYLHLIQQMKDSPIALHTAEANEQHYEVPTEFFKLVMGKYMKYSSGYWKEGVTDFDQSEHDMLEISSQRADIQNGQDVLELGCGWGSMTLFNAEKFPGSRFVGVSNSSTQREHILAEAKKRGLTNIEIITADMNEFTIDRKFDRMISIEMFEHMRNYEKLLAKIATWLKDDGQIFIHIFTHREHAYFYELNDGGFDWMARYFFTGGIMPSDTLLYHFQDHFKVHHHWRVSGTHYQKTSEAWLQNMDTHKDQIMPILEETYGKDYKKWWVYWRVFFMACAELWGYDDGNEWIVSHYVLRKR